MGNWTPETLKEHFEAVLIEKDKAMQAALAAAEKAVNAALAAAQKAVDKAEANAEKWRENANEWRGAMTDKDKSFATKAEFASLKERADLGQGKSSGVSSGWGWAVGVIGLAIAAASIILSFTK